MEERVWTGGSCLLDLAVWNDAFVLLKTQTFYAQNTQLVQITVIFMMKNISAYVTFGCDSVFRLLVSIVV